MSDKQKSYPLRKVFWALIIICFMIMELPGIFFINRIEPMIFGMPFIYGFILIMWAVMCAIMFIAYKNNWGKGKDFVEGEGDE
ncbi:MAG: DUF3311 domain-containing protein [Spirochaetales bacterium]|nr:DUF3311 domain-containing protein [Spirochaetales bacterium]